MCFFSAFAFAECRSWLVSPYWLRVSSRALAGTIAGVSAAEVGKMVVSGRIHVHGMHYLELQVLARSARGGGCAGAGIALLCC